MKVASSSATYSEGFSQFLKFCIVGFSNFIISFFVFYACYTWLRPMSLIMEALGKWTTTLPALFPNIKEWSAEGAFANTVGYGFGMLNSFFWNKTWTFKARSRTWTQARIFLILNIACLGFSTLCIYVFVDVLKGPYKTIWFVTTVFVTIANFLGNKYWTFRHRI